MDIPLKVPHLREALKIGRAKVRAKQLQKQQKEKDASKQKSAGPHL